MAIVANNDLTRGLRGRIGRWLIFREVRGKTIASHAPRKPDPRKQSAAQRLTRSTFREASAWAVRILLDPVKKQYYADVAKAEALPNAYTAAVREYMREVAARGMKEQETFSVSAQREANISEQHKSISSPPTRHKPSEGMSQNVARPVLRLSKGIYCNEQLATTGSNYVRQEIESPEGTNGNRQPETRSVAEGVSGTVTAAGPRDCLRTRSLLTWRPYGMEMQVRFLHPLLIHYSDRSGFVFSKHTDFNLRFSHRSHRSHGKRRGSKRYSYPKS
jgi:hypothetical protein